DDEKYYDKIPDYVKERNMIFMASGEAPFYADEKNKKGGYYKFPLPYGYNIFHVTGTALNDMMRGTATPAETAVHWLSTLVGSFSPVGVSQSEDAVIAVTKTAAPTVLKPFLELGVNENFFGSPIYKEAFIERGASPEAFRPQRSTAALWRKTAEWLNITTGGNQHVSGAIDISPDSLEHIWEFSTGGLGRFADRLYSVTEKKLTGEEIEPREIPFGRVIYGEPSPWEDMGRYYQRSHPMLQHLEAYESLPVAERKEYIKAYPGEVKLGKMAKDSDKKLRKLRKAKKQAEFREDDALVEKIDTQIDAVIDEWNKAYNREVRDK
ncbi:MAG: LPD38 domain-containing protein, partial [Candidatus Binatia bacterium]